MSQAAEMFHAVAAVSTLGFRIGWGIHAFDPAQLTFASEFEAVGLLHSASGKPIQIDGLWALQFDHGNSATSANGLTNTLFFTAGPADEEHGLFGSLVNVPPPGLQ